MNDARLGRLLDAVSDGEDVDWEAAQRQFDNSPASGHCASLETISRIARHGRQDSAQLDAPRPFWTSLLLALALLQTALGMVASIAYRPYSFANALRLLVLLSFAAVGSVLRQSRYNLRARDLGAVFLLSAFAFGRKPYILMFDDWAAQAPWLGWLRAALAVDAWAPYFFWEFAQRFPNTARFALVDRVAVAITKVSLVVGATLLAVNLWVVLAHPATGFLRTLAFDFQEGQRYSAAIFLLSLPVLPVIFLRARSAPADERARVRLFAAAMLAGIAPSYIEVILEAALPPYVSYLQGSPTALTLMIAAVLLPLLFVPFATGYSVLVHRLLDVRWAIGQGVRYLLAKWTLAAVALAPSGWLISYVYARRNDSVVDVFTNGRGLGLLALVVLGAFLMACRTWLLERLDRWFVRRGVDRATVLAKTGDTLRLLRTRSELVVCVFEATESALNADAGLYLFDPTRQAYLPFNRGALPLTATSALATIMTHDPALSVLRTDGEQSISRLLPYSERLWLADAGACLVAPLRASGLERPAGLLVCGPRRDALGYARGDERFVVALAAAVGMALENLRLKSEVVGEESDGEFGLLCRRCRRVTDIVQGQTTCPCGGALESASVPRRINAKFQVEALLGSGGMGVAYLASDMALGRSVAIKTLPSVSADAMARLGREAKTMAALSHPNLATILGHEYWRGTPILICEYLSGGTLQERLTRGPMPIEEALTLGLTLLDALTYMHGQNVLHRDIKPSNIAFTSDKTPKLLDFGLAGLMERVEAPAALKFSTVPTLSATRLAGTIAYMPPQAFRGRPPTPSFDLWSLAVVLYEAVIGQHPFAAGADTAQNVCLGRFVVPLDAPLFAGAIGTFFRTALNLDPAGQFESSSAMRESLLQTRAALS